MRAFAYLTVVVLAVIGVGVSLVNGLPELPPLRTYGSSPLRFEAAFPTSLGRVRASLPLPGLALYAAGKISRGSAFFVYVIDPHVSTGNSNNGGGYLFTTLDPIESGPTTTVVVGGFKADREAVHCGDVHLRYVQKLAAAVEKVASGSSPMADLVTDSSKAEHLCEDAEVVSGHGVQWIVAGAAPTASTAEQFVDSFKPLVASG